MPKKLKRLGWAALTVIVIAGAAGLFNWRYQSSRSSSFTSVHVTRGDIQETVSALGVLVPSQYVDVGAQVSGQLVKLPVGLGDAVKQGQLIAEIDPTKYAAQVAQDQALIADLMAQLSGLRARLALARWTHERNSRLAPQGGATEQALEQSKYDLKTAETTATSLVAQIDKAKNALKVDQANLGYTKITAPISGMVISPTSAIYGNTWSKLDIARQGQTLNANQNAPLLLRIANLDQMLVRAQVSEADMPRLKTGMSVWFTTLGQPDHRIVTQLKTIEITPELVNGAIFYDAIIEVENPSHSLQPQMTAQVFFVVSEAKDTLVVPLMALSSTQHNSGKRIPGCPTVSTSNEDCVQMLVGGQPQARPVKVGIRDELNVQILEGIQVGDVLVTTTGAGGRRGGANGG